MATSDIGRLRSMSVFSPRRRRSISDPMSEDLSDLEPIAEAPQLDIPNISTAGIKKDEPQRNFRTLLDDVNSIYTPESRDADRYRQLLNEYPQREEPSFMRKLVASGQTLGNVRRRIPGGIEQADKVLNAPFNEDLADWTAKTEPFAKAAQFENTANANERALAGNMATANVNLRKIDETERNNRAKEDAAVERNRIARIRAEMGPGFRMDARGTTVKVINQATGEVRDTGITTGWMTEADRIEAEGWWRTEAARVTGQGAMDRAITAGAEIWTDPNGNQYIQNPRDPNSMIPIPQGNAPAQPTGPLTRTQPRGGTTPTERVSRGDRFQAAIDKDPTIGKWFIPPATANAQWKMANMPVPADYKSMGGLFAGEKKYKEDLADFNRARAAVGLPPVGQGQAAPQTETQTETPPAAAATPKPPSRGATNPRDPNYGKSGNGGAASIWDILPNTGSGRGTNPRQPLPSTRSDGKVSIYDPKTGRTGSIDNTPEAIAAAKAAGYQVR